MTQSKQPEPGSKQYVTLIQEIETGLIKIPKFQRNFVWSKAKTAELLDSILKGYPIGTFILWETTERMNYVKNIAGFDFPETPEGYPVQYILDGQQRIASLYAAHKGKKIQRIGENHEIDYGKIYVDLTVDDLDNDEQIVVSEVSCSRYATLDDLLNVVRKRKKLEKIFEEDEMDKLFKYYEAFKTYDFSTVLLKGNDINTAITVFTRINTSGQTLTLFDIMAAKTYDESKDFDMAKKWEEYDKSLDAKNFEGISNVTILSLISLIISNTKECKRSTILKLDKNKIIDAWDDSIEALSRSIDYFRTNYGIFVSHLLPYDALLVSFAYFFLNSEMNEPNTEQRKYLEEFFWRISLSERYSSATESRLAQDIRRIDKIIIGKRPSYNDISVLLSKPDDLINREFRAGRSDCKAILCLLSQQNPMNFHDNSKVILDNSNLIRANSKNYHHFFPKSFLKSENYENENSLMNITLISEYQNKRVIRSQPPSSYIRDFKKSNKDIEKSLQSQFISLNGFGIESDNYSRFLEKRAKLIFREIENRMNP